MTTNPNSENSTPPSPRDEFMEKFVREHPEFLKKLFEKVPRILPEELDVCACVHKGLKNRTTSKILDMSERSVESHRRSVCFKAGLKDGQRLRSYLKIL